MTEPLTTCPECHRFVTPRHVKDVATEGGMIALQWAHACGREGRVVLPPARYRQMVEEWQAGTPPSPAKLNAWQIGNTVQGFRIDLDPVDDLSFLEELWDYQQRWHPDTVPHELAPQR